MDAVSLNVADSRLVDDFNSGESREGDDDRYYSGTGESRDDESYERYLNRG